jgi:S1-C subfamily serine protease
VHGDIVRAQADEPTDTRARVAVASCGVAAFAGDFDDLPEDDPPSQPLPAEDRLWRHPSELGALGASLPLDPITVRRRWLASQPSRGSAWTAGLVGALLATGLVALGTHLASAITAKQPAPGLAHSGDSTLLGSVRSRPSDLRPERGVGALLSSRMVDVGRAMVYLEVSRGGTEVRCIGVTVRSDGMVLAPAAEVAGATSIMVQLPDGAYYVGKVLGSDLSTRAASSGLALVRVEGASHLPVATLGTTPPASTSLLSVLLSSPGGGSFAVGSVSAAAGTATTPGAIIVDALTTDLPTAMAPPGSVLLDSDGQVLGIVTASRSGDALATPGWVAAKALVSLEATGKVGHGWLGVEGATAAGPVRGVRITHVAPGSAAARAGIETGDVVEAVDGKRVTTMSALQGRLYFFPPGARVSLLLDRAGRAVVARPKLDAAQMQ